MTRLFRVRASWTGFPGAPGVSTFYFLDINTATESLHTLFDAMKTILPNDVVVTVGAAGDVIEDTTGALVDSWVHAATLPVGGQSSAATAGPAGLLLGWDTSTILDGHRVRGKTFIVPVSSTQYGVNGSVLPAQQVAIKVATDAFLFEQSLSFVIWHRNRVARAATATHLAVTARAGGHGLVTSTRVPSKVVVLRSRRD